MNEIRIMLSQTNVIVLKYNVLSTQSENIILKIKIYLTTKMTKYVKTHTPHTHKYTTHSEPFNQSHLLFLLLS